MTNGRYKLFRQRRNLVQMMIVPTITIDFLGTVSSNPDNRAYSLPQNMDISVGMLTF